MITITKIEASVSIGIEKEWGNETNANTNAALKWMEKGD